MDNETLTQINISNIHYFFQKVKNTFKNFKPAFCRNNFYGLINLSKDFYENSINFAGITSIFLNQTQAILPIEDSKCISKKIAKVEGYVFQLKKDRDFWLLNNNTIVKKIDFTNAYTNGNEKLNLLAKEMSCLSRLDTIKNSEKNTRRSL